MSAPDDETPAESAREPAAPVPAEPAVFRIGGLAYFGPLMMMVTALALAGTSIVYLGWTLLVPIVVAYWIFRIRTVATPEGVRAVGTLRTRQFDWSELTGLSFPRWGSVRAELSDSSRVRLPAVAFRDLPRLSAVSGGRIPDPYARPDTARPDTARPDTGGSSDADRTPTRSARDDTA